MYLNTLVIREKLLVSSQNHSAHKRQCIRYCTFITDPVLFVHAEINKNNNLWCNYITKNDDAKVLCQEYFRYTY